MSDVSSIFCYSTQLVFSCFPSASLSKSSLQSPVPGLSRVSRDFTHLSLRSLGVQHMTCTIHNPIAQGRAGSCRDSVGEVFVGGVRSNCRALKWCAAWWWWSVAAAARLRIGLMRRDAAGAIEGVRLENGNEPRTGVGQGLSECRRLIRTSIIPETIERIVSYFPCVASETEPSQVQWCSLWIHPHT
jgi:hypothetical protein